MDDGTEWVPVNGGVANVRHFGARGDGVTPDTAAIQAAIDALAPEGGIVCFSPGTYIVTNTLRFDSGIVFQGASANSTIISSNLTAAVFQPKEPCKRHSGTYVRDLQIDNSTKTNSGSVGIDFTNISSGGLTHVLIRNVETGVLLSGTAYHNNLFDLVVSTAVNGIKIISGANENDLFGGRIIDVTTGIKLDNVSNIKIYGASVEIFETGIEIGPTAVASPKIVGCRFENAPISGTGISIAATTLAAVILGPYFQGLVTPISDSGTDTNIVSDVNWKISGGTTIRWHRRLIVPIVFPPIPPHSTSDQFIPINSISNVDSVFITPNPNIPSGLMVMGIPASSNGVYIRMANMTGALIDPAGLNFIIDVWQH